MKKRKHKRKTLVIKAMHSLHVNSKQSNINVNSINYQSVNEFSHHCTLMHYDDNINSFEEISIDSNDYLFNKLLSLQEHKRTNSSKDITWLDVRNFEKYDIIPHLNKIFTIHPITLDNLTDVALRTKLEDFDEYGFLGLQTFYHSSNQLKLFQNNKISMILNNWIIITLQHEEHDSFLKQRKRLLGSLKKSLPLVRTDFLVYFLLDSLIDKYAELLEAIGEETGHLSNLLFKAYSPNLIENLYSLNQYVFLIRRELIPLSEVILYLENGLIIFEDETSSTYFGNINDHILKLIENLNFHRDTLANLMNFYYSLSDQKLNQIMKTLTIVSTIFIPLTFIVGVYGMNFANMPELEWEHGYFFTWFIMLGISISVLLYMKRKKWL